MEDKDKRNSSVPGASSVSSGDDSSQTPGSRQSSEPDMFDPHEQTLPRFTIDPSEAAPRQRTRTLLGVPTLVSEADQRASAPPTVASTPTVNEAADEPRLPVPPTFNETPERAPTGGKLASAIFSSQEAPETLREPGTDGIIDITVELEDHDHYHLDEVTMVSDADVVALPDNTGQLQPVRFEDPLLVAAPARDKDKDKDKRSTQAEAANAATAPFPDSLSPREIARPAAPVQAPRDTSGRGGALLVAAVMLLATGAWFLTAGTFRRATLTRPAESTTAAATQPTSTKAADNKVELPAPPAQTPAPTSAETVSAAPATAPAPTSSAPAPATDDSLAPALKQKPALTASARGERVRRTGRASKASATPAPTGDLPAGPTRTEVVARLESVRSSVQACAAGRTGVADLDVTIAHTGVVTHVLVGGDFAGTTQGSCIARAVRQARFPQFKQERFRLLYPYAI
jgi:hypothetical protein